MSLLLNSSQQNWKLESIQNIYYINLEHRIDRKDHIINELKKLNIYENSTCFKAIQHKNGAIGCSLSHLKILQIALKNNFENILILEDDIYFTNPTLFKIQFENFFKKNISWDVILFAGNNIDTYTNIDNICVKIKKCQTTTGYFVNKHYIPLLINNIKIGLLNLMKYPHLHNIYAIDKYWFKLQQIDNWYLIIPLTVTQLNNYSDIEKRITNYDKLMLSLDK